MSAIESIPVGILDHIGWAFRILETARDEILRQRQLEEQVGEPGRYEYEYRAGHNYPNVRAAKKALRQFEALASKNGYDPQAIYAELGGLPEVPDWSPEALRWRRP